jgi:protein arginine kinase
MSKNPNNNRSALTSLHAPWDNNDNVIWLSSTVRLCRNIEKFKFPHKMESERKAHLLQLISNHYLQSTSLKDPLLLKGEEMAPHEKEFLIEHFFLSEGFQEAHEGSAFSVDKTGELIALFNIKDHLQLQCTDTSGDLEKAYSRVMTIENEIGKSLNFAFNTKFGFLTGDPLHCGTGLIVSSYLHIPALIHTKSLTDALEKEKSEGIVASGLQGNPDELVGDILMLRNLYTLGVNEESILSTMRSAIMHIVVAEKGIRTRIKQEKMPLFKDLISRACGSLKFSYQIEAPEALSQISLLKLGLELGWVKGMSIKEVNSLFIDSRRSHLSYLLGETVLAADISTKRAEFLRKKTEGILIEF